MGDLLIWDNHGCLPLTPYDTSFLPQLQRYRTAGVDVVSLNIGMDTTPWADCLLMLAQFRAWIKRHSNDYVLVERVADIERSKSEGKLAVSFDLEGGRVLNGQIDMLQLYYDLGVRWMLIAYNLNNELGGGCQDHDGGLTDFGRQVIREMERIGMVVCCSHTGYRTAMEVIERATKPVIFSHSNPLSVWSHKRNIRDELIRACAQTDGVIGVNGVGVFLDANEARTESVVRHIDYVAQLVGPRHVGLGLDYVFDQIGLNASVGKKPDVFPADQGYASEVRFVEPERIPEIVESLKDRGYDGEDLAGVLGGNHLRIAQTVWVS
jgi:membrane dipeptidase